MTARTPTEVAAALRAFLQAKLIPPSAATACDLLDRLTAALASAGTERESLERVAETLKERAEKAEREFSAAAGMMETEATARDAAERERDALQARFNYMADSLPADWSHCTTEKELCDQIKWVLQEIDRQSLAKEIAEEAALATIRERDKAREQVRVLREALEAVIIMRDTKKPRKLDEALSWRQNDDHANALAEAALSLSATPTRTEVMPHSVESRSDNATPPLSPLSGAGADRDEKREVWRPTHRHYKGSLYRVIGEAVHTETSAFLTVYDNADGSIFARPQGMFHGKLEDGRDRFAALPEEETP